MALTDILSLTSVAINDAQWQLAQGATALIGLHIRKAYAPQKFVAVSHEPLITLWNPVNEVIIDTQPMTTLAIGKYGYAYTTTPTDLLGVYTAQFDVLHIDYRAKLHKSGVFLLTKGEFAFFTYFVINDFTGKSWYWLIDTANQLVSLPVIPPDGVRMAKALYDTPYDSIQLINADGFTRWVYPDMAGQPFADVAPPAGTVHIGSPLLQNPFGQDFMLELDILDQILVVPA